MPLHSVHSKSTWCLPRCVLFIAITLCWTSAYSQQAQYAALTNPDSAEVWFDKIVNPASAAIVNGPEYRITVQGYKTNPFYLKSESDRTYLHYDNDLYRNVDLLYDSYSDILVYKYVTASKVLFITLDNNLVQDFNLHRHSFKKYSEGQRAGIGSYFDVLFEKDAFAVLVKRRKVVRLEGDRSDFVEDDVYYILDHGKWTRITGNGSFNKSVDKNQRKELSTYIKSNKINIRKRKDDELKKLGAFCYSLKERK